MAQEANTGTGQGDQKSKRRMKSKKRIRSKIRIKSEKEAKPIAIPALAHNLTPNHLPNLNLTLTLSQRVVRKAP
jgi:hypothetical protein